MLKNQIKAGIIKLDSINKEKSALLAKEVEIADKISKETHKLWEMDNAHVETQRVIQQYTE
jgi:hypothetical protein